MVIVLGPTRGPVRNPLSFSKIGSRRERSFMDTHEMLSRPGWRGCNGYPSVFRFSVCAGYAEREGCAGERSWRSAPGSSFCSD